MTWSFGTVKFCIGPDIHWMKWDCYLWWNGFNYYSDSHHKLDLINSFLFSEPSYTFNIKNMKNAQCSVASILISVIPNNIYLLKTIHCTQIHTKSSMIICALHCAKPYAVSNVKICIHWMNKATNKQIMQTIANIYRNAKPRKFF